MPHLLRLSLLFLGLATIAPAALDPQHFLNIASDVFRLREIARIDTQDLPNHSPLRRITIVAEVKQVFRSGTVREPGTILVIDYTIDTAALNQALREEAAKPAMPGPQLLVEPEPPELDARGEFVAYLAPVAGRLGNVNRYVGAHIDWEQKHFRGDVFVPVSAQYSFSQSDPVR